MFCTIKLPIKIKNVARFDGRNFLGLRTDDRHVFCATHKNNFYGEFWVYAIVLRAAVEMGS